MRVGACVIFYKGHCFQSFGLNDFKFLGSSKNVFEAVDHHGFSEICIIRPAKPPLTGLMSSHRSGDIDSYLGIPTILVGGVEKSLAHDPGILRSIERVAFNSLLFEPECAIQKVVDIFGKQAVVGMLPFVLKDGIYMAYNVSSDVLIELTSDFISKIYSICDEVVIHDICAHGKSGEFDLQFITKFEIPVHRTIACGGVSPSDLKRFSKLGFSAVYLDNISLHSDSVIDGYLR